MVFHSVTFFGFLFAVYILYRFLPHRFQNRLLLIASYVFYSFWDWRCLFLILVSTGTDFLCAGRIYQATEKSVKKRYVALSCIVNIGILFFFKYYNFFIENLLSIFHFAGLNVEINLLKILLPIGISFYTFQSISYTVDVYRKQLKPVENFFDYALFLSFFPKLVQGPIERGKNLLPQILMPRNITVAQTYEGFHLIYLGLFKKLVLASNLAVIVDPLYGSHSATTGGMVLVAGYAYLFQVYCDFSAYTDIARGVGKLFGFELMENFRAPYLASNIQEFWGRWHISLTTWIRDYIYYPLAFKRFGKKSIDVKLLTIITFFIMGLWHGASWNYILWGGFHGAALAIYTYYTILKKKWSHSVSCRNNTVWVVLSVIATFHVCFIGDVFFRAGSFQQAFNMLSLLVLRMDFNSDTGFLLLKTFVIALPMILFDLVTLKYNTVYNFFQKYRVIRYVTYYLMLYCLMKFSIDSKEYIYFQF